MASKAMTDLVLRPGLRGDCFFHPSTPRLPPGGPAPGDECILPCASLGCPPMTVADGRFHSQELTIRAHPGVPAAPAPGPALCSISALHDAPKEFVACPVAAHAPWCPVRFGHHSTAKGQWPTVASCAVVIDADGKALLTQRAPTLRTFPGQWVLPGGRVDDGETLYEAALRELQEEAGVDLFPEDKAAAKAPTYAAGDALPVKAGWRAQWLGLWESSFQKPGTPEDPHPCPSQCLVAYFLFEALPQTPRPVVNLQVEECSAEAWVTVRETTTISAEAAEARATPSHPEERHVLFNGVGDAEEVARGSQFMLLLTSRRQALFGTPFSEVV